MTAPADRLAAALADRYRIERELGQGGMATVFLAEDLKHHRKVALKVLRPELAATMGIERFAREIEVAARLQHPHILPLHDSGEAGGFFYYVMPYVEGETLRERLNRTGELPIHESVRLLTEIGEALSMAHRHGVVHRDIKPENILLSGRHAQVMDFGVAKAVTEASGRQQLTTAGVALGTPAYMAPEQATADPHLDGRVDIYALGVLAYEMLTGRPPFHGRTPQATLAAHVTQPPAPVRQGREVSPALEAVVMRCLEKRPADRYQTADEVVAALEPLATPSGGMTPAHTQPVGAVQPTVSGTRRWLVLIGAGAALVAVASLASHYRGSAGPAVQVGRRSQVTLAPGLEIYPALSPDGKLIAYSAGAEYRLFVRQVDGGNAIALAPDRPGIQGFPHWAPDGRQLSFSSTRGLELVPALGGTPRLLVSGTVMAGPWSPDGREISFIRNDSLLAVPVDGGAPRVIVTIPEMHSCAWSPTGARIACVSGNRQAILPFVGAFGNVAPSRVATVPAKGGAPAWVTPDSSANVSPAWGPDGSLLIVSDREGGRDVYAVRLTARGEAAGPPVRLTTGLNAMAITTTPDGGQLGYAEFHETSNVWTMPIPARGEASVSQATPVTRGNQVIEQFDVSPDGAWLVFDSDRSGNADLYRVPLPGPAEPEPLTRTPANEFWPTYSPDGREIAFHVFEEGRRQAYVMPAGGGPPTPVARNEDDDRTPVWSPDGRSVFISSNQEFPSTAVTRKVTRSADGAWGPPTVWWKGNCQPLWRPPDGRVVTCTLPSGEMLITSPDGDSLGILHGEEQLPGETIFPVWADDGRWLYYLDASASNIIAWAVGSDTPRVVVRFDDPTRPWHRYGLRVRRGRFYFTIGDLQSDLWVARLERR